MLGPRYYQNKSEVKVPDAGEDVLREMRKGASGVGRIVYGKEFVGKLR